MSAIAELPEKVSVLCPVLVTVTVCDALDEPTSTDPNCRLCVESDAIGGAMPVPVRLTV